LWFSRVQQTKKKINKMSIPFVVKFKICLFKNFHFHSQMCIFIYPYILICSGLGSDFNPSVLRNPFQVAGNPCENLRVADACVWVTERDDSN